MVSGYMPSSAPFEVAQRTLCAAPHMHGPQLSSVTNILVRDLLPSFSAARPKPIREGHQKDNDHMQ